MFRKVTFSLLAFALVLPANTQIGKVFEGLSNRGETSDSKTASGLREALQIGTDHAVDLTGITDGFFKNEAIKILLPEKLRTAEKMMRMAGMGPELDEFELSMNRAAEKAAPAARGIFKDALMQMTFDDARKILTGGNTSATEYFKGKTVVVGGAESNGRIGAYQSLVARNRHCSCSVAAAWMHETNCMTDPRAGGPYMPGTFEIKKAKDGQTFFHLKAENGQIILASEMYKSKESVLNGIESVKKNAPLAERYERLTSKNGKFYFTLKAANSQVIGNSEMYQSESSRDNGMDSVMKNAPTANLIEIAAKS